MRRLHYLQVLCHVTRQIRSTSVHSMFLRMVLRRGRPYCQDEAGGLVVSFTNRRVDNSDSPPNKKRLAQVLWVSSAVAVLVTGLVTRTLGASIDKYLGMPVAKVQFTSEDFIDLTALEKAVAVAVGKPLEAADVRQSISTLYQTREFSQIETDASLGDAGLVITFKLRPNFFFADFRLRGDPVLRSPMSGLVPLPLGEAYSPKIVEQLQQKAQEALRDAGYYKAEVFPDVQFLSKARLVTVNYIVNAGQRATISGIDIVGSPLLERTEILQTIKLRPGKYFDSEALKRDFERLRKLYAERGFLNATLRG